MLTQDLAVVPLDLLRFVKLTENSWLGGGGYARFYSLLTQCFR